MALIWIYDHFSSLQALNGKLTTPQEKTEQEFRLLFFNRERTTAAASFVLSSQSGRGYKVYAQAKRQRSG
jgi:hypothetical protein